MSWMIMLIREKDLGRGCASCRFLNQGVCTADERVNVFCSGDVDEYRPYTCPFRYYDDNVFPITKRFNGMTEEETRGWFMGADFEARHYAKLEEERDKYVKYLVGKNAEGR